LPEWNIQFLFLIVNHSFFVNRVREIFKKETFDGITLFAVLSVCIFS